MKPLHLSPPDLGGNELRYVVDAMLAGDLTHHGRYLSKFATAIGGALELKDTHTVLPVSSGTAALHLALLAAGIGPGDEVLVPDLTFAAPAAVVRHVGATPVLVDVRPDNWGLDPYLAEKAITERTRAVIAVHLFGMAADIIAIDELTQRHGLVLIEDCAEAFGGDVYGRPLGSLGHYGCFSFYANKHITTGEGGAVVCPTELAPRVALFRDGGFVPGSGQYFHTVPGLNCRMTNLQAAIGCAQLERFASLVTRRSDVVRHYGFTLKGKGSWFFCAKVKDTEYARRRLNQVGVPTRAMFVPLHRLPPYQSERAFPVADEIFSTHICLPTGSHLDLEDVYRIINEVRPLQ